MTTSVASKPRPGVQTWLGLAGFIVVLVAVAGLGGLAASGSSDTYRQLDRPAWAPPGSVFGPVWSILYVAIAVAGWLVWRRVGIDAAMVPYGVQLVLNAAWTPLFFAAGWYGVALVEILVLLAAIVVTIVQFWPRSRVAAVLLLPYLAWVAFATCLNASIWWLNR